MVCGKETSIKVSIDKKANSRNTTYPQNLIVDIAKHTDVHLEVDYNRLDVLNGIAAAIAMLSDQEQKMVILRYRYHCTLEEVGNQFDLTNERARQIIIRALRKLVVKPRRMLITEGLEGHIESEAKRIADVKTRIALHNEYMRGYEKGYAVGVGKMDENETSTEESDETLLVTDMCMSIRTTNCLVRAKLETLEDLLKVDSIDTIHKVRNLGKKSAGEVAKRLNDLGFTETVWDTFLEFWHEPKPIFDIDGDLDFDDL